MVSIEEIIGRDFAACFLALANALEAKGVLTKSDIAAAAQERYLVLQARMPAEGVARFAMLKALATGLERMPGD